MKAFALQAWLMGALLLDVGSSVLMASEITGPWLEQVTKRGAGRAAPVQPVRASFLFGWSGIPAAEAEFTLRLPGSGRWQAEVRGRTIGLTAGLWPMEALYQGRGRTANWTTDDFQQTEWYRRHRLELKIEFVPEGVRRWRQREPSPDRAEWRLFRLQGLRDIVAASFLVRSWELRDGERFQLLVYPGDDPFLAGLEVRGREDILWRGEPIRAVRLDLRLDRIETRREGRGSLRPHRRFRHGSIWLEEGGARRPLRAEVGVFIGFVYAELVEWDELR